MTARKRHWLMKSEPDAFSIDDLQRVGTEPWNGVRNYQARNFMRDGMRVGDGVMIYHSNTKVPGCGRKGKSPPWRCVRNDLEPGVQVGTRGGLRASRSRRTCTPGCQCAPVVVIKGQGECLRALSRTAEDAWPV